LIERIITQRWILGGKQEEERQDEESDSINSFGIEQGRQIVAHEPMHNNLNLIRLPRNAFGLCRITNSILVGSADS
jgi:anti-sigma factor ChrR (cupin superfamily)